MGIDLWRIGGSSEERLSDRMRDSERGLGVKSRNTQAVAPQRGFVGSGSTAALGPGASAVAFSTQVYVPDTGASVLVTGNAAVQVTGAGQGQVIIKDDVDLTFGYLLFTFTNTLNTYYNFPLGAATPGASGEAIYFNPHDSVVVPTSQGLHTYSIVCKNVGGGGTAQITAGRLRVLVL